MKAAAAVIIPVRTLHQTRFAWKPSPKVKLSPVTHGCSLTVPELKGMLAIRAALLFARVNAHAELLG